MPPISVSIWPTMPLSAAVATITAQMIRRPVPEWPCYFPVVPDGAIECAIWLTTKCHDSPIDWVLRATQAGRHLGCSVGVSLAMIKSRRRNSAPFRLMNRAFVLPSGPFCRIYADGFAHTFTSDP
jgi:hypothetical protein